MRHQGPEVVNGLGIIHDKVFNPDVGAIEEIVVQQGSDAGVANEITLTEDAIRGGPLRNARAYYYAVTAYSYGPVAVDGLKTLENSRQALTVIPQQMVSGVDLGPVDVTDPVYNPVDPNIPPPTNVIEIRVVEPTRVTGDTYSLEFYAVDPRTEIIDGTAYPVTQEWRVTNENTTEVVLDEQFNLTGNGAFDVFDGIQINMTGVYEPQVQDAVYLNIDETNGRGLSWVNWGGRWFHGAWDTGCHWSGSRIQPEEEGCVGGAQPDRFATVELRYNATQKAYRYDRRDVGVGGEAGGAPDNGRGYTYSGFVDSYCTAWKVVGDVETQLVIMFNERQVCDQAGTPLPDEQQPESRNELWQPTAESDGGREYVTILDLPYSEDETTYGPTGTDPVSGEPVNLMQDGIYFDGDNNFPALYGGWLRQRGSAGVIDPDDKFVTIWGNPADDNDRWDFRTTAATGTSGGEIDPDLSLAQTRADLERIRVVPNPYLTSSAYEINQFNRVVKFINLPATCTVRVFTLAGDLVRRLEKDDANTSILEWDLENEFELPVGSGVFVYHIEAPGIGNTFGKMIVFMERETLQEF